MQEIAIMIQAIATAVLGIVVINLLSETKRLAKRISSLEIEFENCRLNAKFIASKLMKMERKD